MLGDACFAGVRVPPGASLTVFGPGSLAASGIRHLGGAGAGIGGNVGEGGGTVTIEGGVITATGGYYSAGIEGGMDGSGGKLTPADTTTTF